LCNYNAGFSREKWLAGEKFRVISDSIAEKNFAFLISLK